MLVKLPMGDPAETIDKVRRIYSEVVPQVPFEFQFLDQQYDALYHSENRMGRVFQVFSILAIAIACLGLLGLVSFSVSQRTKEIGIRKVMGATASNIVLLLTSGYTKLVLLASLIGFPVAYWSMDRWLRDFAYKVDIGAGPILIAALGCLIVAFLTSSFHALKATFINPANTLRND
jgi:putative ABC transport system permease protein